MAFLELRAVTKSYATSQGRHLVLQGIDLAVEEGEFVAIVGYSGSGKTTLISMIAGLIEPDDGESSSRKLPSTGQGPTEESSFKLLAPSLVQRVRKHLPGGGRRVTHSLEARETPAHRAVDPPGAP